jgi:hypothetical protein
MVVVILYCDLTIRFVSTKTVSHCTPFEPNRSDVVGVIVAGNVVAEIEVEYEIPCLC